MAMPFDSTVPGTSPDQATIPDRNDSPSAELNPNSAPQEPDASIVGFVDRVTPPAKRYAMSLVHCWADAEEIVQESFCRLHQSHLTQPFEPNSDARRKATLFTIIRNLSIDLIRTHQRHQFESIDASQISNKENTTDETRLARLESEIQNSMNQMPRQWSDALQLKINGELSYAEISDVLAATHAQVRTWIFRARKQLESDLAQHGFGGGQHNE